MLLPKLRRAMRPLLWIVAIAFVGSLFFMYGVSRRQGGQGKPLAEVNGAPISYASFARSYRNLYDRYQQSFKGEITPQMENYLKYRVLSSLITDELLWQEAKKAKIRVTEDEVTDEIKKIIERFSSRENFMRFLSYGGIPYPDFKEEIKKELAINKLIQRVRDSIDVTDEEVKAYWIKENERVKLEYLLIRTENYEKEVKPTREEVEKYYEDYKKNFTVPEKVRVKYILINPDDFKDRVKVTPEKLKEYYQDHLADYEVDEQRRVSHILVQVPPNATEEETKKAEEKIKKIQKKLKDGADFAELAKKYSDDSFSAEKGGDLGYFTRGQMLPSFSEVVFSLKDIGEVSDVVRTPLGYHLIKLTGIKPPYTKPFEKVESQVRERFIREESEKLAKREAERLREEMKNNAYTFKQYAREHPDQVNLTPLFARNERIENLGWVPQFNNVAFSLKQGEIGPLVETPRGYCILTLEEKKPSYIPPLNEIEEEVKKKLIERRATEIAGEEAKKIKKMVEKEKDLSLFASKRGLEYKKLDYFRRGDWIGEIDSQDKEEFVKAAFSLAEGEVSEPLLLTKGYYIIKLTGRDLSLEEFSKRREEFAERLLSQKRASLLSMWLQKIREEAKIVDNSSLFFSP